MCEKCDNYVSQRMIQAGVEQVKRWDNTKEPLEVAVARIYAAMVAVHEEYAEAMTDSLGLRLEGRLN